MSFFAVWACDGSPKLTRRTAELWKQSSLYGSSHGICDKDATKSRKGGAAK
jgi:hypothetical protein